MRIEADQPLIARDSALPGLARLLDAEGFTAALRTLPGLGDVVAAEPRYLRYKPQTSCVAAYRLMHGDGGTSMISAKALPAERFAHSWQRPRWQGAVRRGDADAPRALPEESVLVLLPQHDRGVPALRQLGTPKRAAALLRDLLGRHVDSDSIEPAAAHWSLDRHTLRWKPGRRWVGRVELGNGEYAVLRAGSGSAFGHALLGATLAAAHGGAALLGADAQRQLFASAWIPGNALCPQTQGHLDLTRIAEAGQLLGRLHCSPLHHPLHRSSGSDQRALCALVADLALLDGDLARQATDSLHRVVATLARLPETESVLIHGDFSLDQIVDDGHALHLIDWDRSARGAAAIDLGTLQARLEYQALQGDLQADAVAPAMHLLLDGYTQTRPEPVAGVHVHAAAALLKLVIEPFRSRMPDWPQRIAALLQRVDALLAETPAVAVTCHTQARAATSDSHAAFNDPAMPVLADALDTQRMQPCLATALTQPDEALRIERARLLRHKPGRRALVEYQVQLGGSASQRVLAKLRAKGVDRTGYGVQRQLWQQRHDGRHFQVPEPLTMIPELHLWLQRHVDGQVATDHLQPTADTDTAHAIGQALAALHAAPLDGDRQWQLDDELGVLQRGLFAAASDLPHLAVRIAQLMEACTALAATLPPARRTWIHRDFYPDQVLIPAHGPPVLLDFDLCARGDPALDAGNFNAHLLEYALRTHGDAAALADKQHAFTAAFLADSNRVSAISVDIHTTLSLARHVHLSTRFDARRHATEAILSHCEARIARK